MELSITQVEGVFSNITKISEDDFDRTQAVNVKGVWLSVKFQIECFLRQNTAGSILTPLLLQD